MRSGVDSARIFEPGGEASTIDHRSPCVIALHGAVANAAAWLPLERCLGDAADLIAGDLPGHGTRRDEVFAFDPVVASITALVLDEATRRPVILAGDSLGGYLALAVAARAGDAVRGVVAGSCTYPLRGVPALLSRATLLADPFIPPGAFAALMRRVCTPDVADAIVARGVAPAMRGATLRALLGYDVLRDVAAIVSPVVFVDGAFDVPIVCYAAAFARTARSGRAVIVRGASHGVGLTHPAVFAAAIRNL